MWPLLLSCFVYLQSWIILHGQEHWVKNYSDRALHQFNQLIRLIGFTLHHVPKQHDLQDIFQWDRQLAVTGSKKKKHSWTWLLPSENLIALKQVARDLSQCSSYSPYIPCPYGVYCTSTVNWLCLEHWVENYSDYTLHQFNTGSFVNASSYPKIYIICYYRTGDVAKLLTI